MALFLFVPVFETIRDGELHLKKSTDDKGSPLLPLLKLYITLTCYGPVRCKLLWATEWMCHNRPCAKAYWRWDRSYAYISSQNMYGVVTLMKLGQSQKASTIFGSSPGVRECIGCTYVQINSPCGYNAEVYGNGKVAFSIDRFSLSRLALYFATSYGSNYFLHWRRKAFPALWKCQIISKSKMKFWRTM